MSSEAEMETWSSVTTRTPEESEEVTTSVKEFLFRAAQPRSGGEAEEFTELTVTIPERMESSYGLYVWPSAPILAWYLFQHRQLLPNTKLTNTLQGDRCLDREQVLELGAGTGLPGIVAALCGAHVTLTDSPKLPHCLEQSKKSVEANGLLDRVKIVGLGWGSFSAQLLRFKGQVDLLLGSDCFYDPVVFEDLLCTVSYLLQNNPSAKFLCTYQERSSDWSIVPLLTKWGLTCSHILLSDLATSCQIDLAQLMQGHSIHLLEITLKALSPN